VLLDGGVVAQEPDGRVGDAAQLRQHDQPFDAGRAGGVDEVELLALGPFGRRRDEVGAPDALQGGAQRTGVVEVGHDLLRIAGHLGVGRADHHPHDGVPREQFLDQGATRVARRSGDEHVSGGHLLLLAIGYKL
jgi:hypothetical protein